MKLITLPIRDAIQVNCKMFKDAIQVNLRMVLQY